MKGIGARRRMYEEGLAIAGVRLVARNRRRYGGYVVHFGVVVMFAAFAGMYFKKDYAEVELKQGDTYTAVDPWGDSWTFTSEGMSTYETLNRRVTAVSLRTTRNGEPMGMMLAEKRQHFDASGNTTFEPSTEVAIKEMAKQDVYVFFSGLLDTDTAVAAHPLQPAGGVGVDRRIHHGVRRRDRDVAAGGAP